MREIYTNTLKYFRLAIKEFLPYIKNLQKENQDENIKASLNDLIDMYKDVAEQIDSFNLNLEDPNRYYDGEPLELSIDKLGFNDEMLEHFSRLVINLLSRWKERREKLERRGYLNEQTKEELYELRNLIWPLEAQFNNHSVLIYKHKNKGPIEFPGEKKRSITDPKVLLNDGVFPGNLLIKLHPDIKKICEEFNFCYVNKKPYACLLLLRRILPLSIIRRFQQLNIEEQIKENDDFLETKQLLGKVQVILSNKRIYDEVMSHKIIIDASQHVFTFKPDMLDVKGPGNAIRIFLEDLFFQKEE